METDEAVDHLYSLPLEEFTPARDALAREAGKGPERDRIKKLRKPTLSAWAVNQAVRAEPGLLEALLGAGGELRQAHRQAARGNAERLREAGAAEREAVEALARAARTAAGKRAGEPFLDRVRETLHAASLDPEARDLVAAGRVVADLRAVGLGDFGPEPGGGRSGPTKAAAAPQPDLRPLRRAVQTAERAVASAQTRVDNAEAALAEAREELKRHKKRLSEAQKELKNASK